MEERARRAGGGGAPVGDGLRALDRERADAGPAAVGAWLGAAGFGLGQAYEAAVRAEWLVVRTV